MRRRRSARPWSASAPAPVPASRRRADLMSSPAPKPVQAAASASATASAAMARLCITDGNELTIEHRDGRRYAIHPIWLRERCQDASTIDLHTGQRLQDPSDLDVRLALSAVTQPEVGKIRVQFSDGHQADFLERDILAEVALAAGDHDLLPPRLWDAALRPGPHLRWNSQPSDDERAQWLARFLELG